METILILNVLFYISLCIVLFDLDYNKTKLPEEPDVPKWVNFVYWIEIITWVWILFIDWRFAVLGIVIYYLSGIIPLPQIIGNFLMSPFKSKTKDKHEKLAKRKLV